jgi:hypothetical protein
MNYASARAVALAAAMVALVFPITPHAVQAQSIEMKASVPFEFYINDQKFLEGSYTVRSLGNSVVQISDMKGHSTMIKTMPSTNRSSELKGKLIFNRYKDVYILSEVLWSGYSHGGRLPRSSFENEVAKNGSAERVVTIKTNQ